MSNKQPGLKKSHSAFSPALVVLSAPSGTGKSTLAAMLLEKHKSRLKLSVSHTTRLPRGTEKNGEHYFFVPEPEFKRMIEAGDFLEYAHVFGKSWYGTSKSFVEKTLTQGQSVLFDIDVQGADALKKIYGKKCITVFIHPPSFEELENRLKNRKTESEEAIQNRLKTARQELGRAPSFDHQIVNQSLEKAYAELEALLTKENCI